MRRIRSKKIKSESKTNNNKHVSSFLDTKEKIIKTAIAGSIILIIVIALMFIESGEGQITIKNDSDLKLEYARLYFVNGEGPVSEEVEFSNIEAGQLDQVASGEHELLNKEANLEIYFKFENYDEMFVDAGIFNENFEGDIKVDFEQTDDKNIINMNVKASTGLLTSKLVDCNEKFSLNLAEGFVGE